jgi:hypothetical protein
LHHHGSSRAEKEGEQEKKKELFLYACNVKQSKTKSGTGISRMLKQQDPKTQPARF